MDEASKVVLDITISLDGFIARPDDDVSRLHEWLFSGDTPSGRDDFFSLSPESAKVFDELVETTGSIITGRRTYGLVGGWGGSHPVADRVVVISHDVPSDVPEGPTTFTFVTEGVATAVEQAKKAAGAKNVYLLGGPSVVQECLRAGLVDQVMLHVVPVLLGEGIRLFDDLGDDDIELEPTRVVDAPGVTHLGFRVDRRLAREETA